MTQILVRPDVAGGKKGTDEAVEEGNTFFIQGFDYLIAHMRAFGNLMNQFAAHQNHVKLCSHNPADQTASGAGLTRKGDYMTWLFFFLLLPSFNLIFDQFIDILIPQFDISCIVRTIDIKQGICLDPVTLCAVLAPSTNDTDSFVRARSHKKPPFLDKTLTCLFLQSLKTSHNIEELFCNGHLARAVKLDMKILKLLFNILLGILHRGQTAGIFAGQGFGKGAIKGNEEIFPNQRRENQITIHPEDGQ